MSWYPHSESLEGNEFKRWVRTDGAEVKFYRGSPHVNEANPRSLLWIAFEPDPSARYLRRTHRNSYKGSPRRFKTALLAMAAIDREFPVAGAE